MKRFLAMAFATTALAAAAPSYAQNGDDLLRGLRSVIGNPAPDPAERDLNDQESRMTDFVERSAGDGKIDRRQADKAFGDLRAIHGQRDDLRARHGGRITPADHDYLRDRLAGLDREIHEMRAADRDRGPDSGRADFRRDGDFWDRAPHGLDEREAWLDRRIHDGMADGSLDRGEASRGLDQLASIRQDESRYLRRDRGDLTDDHRSSLTERLDDLGRQLRWDQRH